MKQSSSCSGLTLLFHPKVILWFNAYDSIYLQMSSHPQSQPGFLTAPTRGWTMLEHRPPSWDIFVKLLIFYWSWITWRSSVLSCARTVIRYSCYHGNGEFHQMGWYNAARIQADHVNICGRVRKRWAVWQMSLPQYGVRQTKIFVITTTIIRCLLGKFELAAKTQRQGVPNTEAIVL